MEDTVNSHPHTTVLQLQQSFECGQPLEATLCRAIAA